MAFGASVTDNVGTIVNVITQGAQNTVQLSLSQQNLNPPTGNPPITSTLTVAQAQAVVTALNTAIAHSGWDK